MCGGGRPTAGQKGCGMKGGGEKVKVIRPEAWVNGTLQQARRGGMKGGGMRCVHGPVVSVPLHR